MRKLGCKVYTFILIKLLIMVYKRAYLSKTIMGSEVNTTNHVLWPIICSTFFVLLCRRFPEEEAGELRADPGGAREDPEDGAAFRAHQSQAEGGGCHQRSGHHLLGCSL